MPAGSDSFTTSQEMIAPSVQLIRLFVPAGETIPQITIRADQTLDPISPLLYGLNHRYLNSGYGVWDAGAQVVSERHTPTPHYGISLDQGLFVANMLRTMIELGVPSRHDGEQEPLSTPSRQHWLREARCGTISQTQDAPSGFTDILQSDNTGLT